MILVLLVIVLRRVRVHRNKLFNKTVRVRVGRDEGGRQWQTRLGSSWCSSRVAVLTKGALLALGSREDPGTAAHPRGFRGPKIVHQSNALRQRTPSPPSRLPPLKVSTVHTMLECIIGAGRVISGDLDHGNDGEHDGWSWVEVDAGRTGANIVILARCLSSRRSSLTPTSRGSRSSTAAVVRARLTVRAIA